MSEQIIIDVNNLTKQYKKHVVVDHASFQIKKGSICGLIGPNGAGKTTIMKMLGGLVLPTEGSMSIFGNTDETSWAKARERMSFMIEIPYAGQNLTAHQNLEKQRIQKEIKRKRPFMAIRIKDGLSFKEAAQLHLNAPDLMGIQIEEDLIRVYPLKETNAHLVGYVSLMNDKDLEENPDNPLADLPGYRIGRTGLENSFEEALKGIPGIRKREVNAYGRTVQILEETPSPALNVRRLFDDVHFDLCEVIPYCSFDLHFSDNE